MQTILTEPLLRRNPGSGEHKLKVNPYTPPSTICLTTSLLVAGQDLGAV